MIKTRNTLPEKVRRASVDMLNQALAELIDLALQAKQAHWNVRGPAFKAVHELFDEISEAAREWADLAAERATALGGLAEGTVQKITERSGLKAYPVDVNAQAKHIKLISDALAKAGDTTRSYIEKADEAGDPGTADLFTEISNGIDKYLWMVEAHEEPKGK